MEMKLGYLALLLLGVHECLALNPILLVPGDGGSLLTARYTESPPHLICGVRKNWFVLWLNLFYMTPITINCFVDTVKLEYDPATRKTSSPEFCEVTVDGFGSSDAVEYFSCLKVEFTSYYYYIIQALVSEFGYVRNKSIRGAPYDFRKTPNEMEEFQSNVTKLIEQMYVENHNSSVVIMAHSMGNMYVLRILHKQTQAWKDKYIKSFISVSPPYAGAVDAVRTALSGNTEHVPILSPIDLREAQSSWPSTFYLMPIPGLWKKGTIVATKEGNFTAETLPQVLKSSGIPYAEDHMKDIAKITEEPVAPNVPVHCIYSDNIMTPEFLDYRNGDFPNNTPSITYGDGDGTVNLQSLKYCSGWKDQQTQPVTTDIIPSVKHLAIMRSEALIKLVIEIIKKDY